MTPQRLKNLKIMDGLLEDLALSVPRTRHVVLLSADGLCVARYGGDRGAGERLAAAASGLTSLTQSIATELPHSEGEVRTVVLEVDGGFFYLMAAGERSYLAVTADEGVDTALMSHRMRVLVARLGDQLPTGERHPEQAT